MAPTTTARWLIQGTTGFECLQFQKSNPLPPVGDNDVLVQIRAVSLNFRDVIIAKGQYSFPFKNGIVPTSDGAGEVVSVGSKVSRFQPGARVAVMFYPDFIAGSLSPEIIGNALGGTLDGPLRQYGVFNEQALVDIPSHLTYVEASTLPCAALTAWNALYGPKPIKPGDIVLTQGTGGVSLFAIQFAVAAGAEVIATTSSHSKTELLKSLGARHVINYKETPAWGTAAKELTAGKKGVTTVVDVGGNSTLAESFKAVKMDSTISVVGFLGDGAKESLPGLLDCLMALCTVRGVIVGSRVQFEEMNQAIEINKIKPVVDPKIFKFEELREAYQYLWEQKHVGKVVITID